MSSTERNWKRGGSARRWAVAAGLLLLSVGAFWGGRKAYVAWCIHVARGALAEGTPGRALVALRRAEAFEPEDAELLYLLGRALRRSGDLESVHAYLDRAAQAGWPEDEVRNQRYLALVQTGNFQQTAAFLNEVMQKGADDELAEEIYEARARGFLAIYDMGDALLCLDYWVRWRPQARQARMWRAEIWERMAVWQKATAEYRDILAHNPGDYEARLKLAERLLWDKDVHGALREYQTCAASRPDDAAALLGIAKCLRRTGEAAEARAKLSALLHRQLTPTEKGEVLQELGEIALFDQDYAHAVEYLTRAREADPVNSSVYGPLSRAYARAGQPELAEQARRQGEQSTQRNTRLTALISKLVKDTENPDVRYEIGMLFMEEGAKREGAAWLLTALRFAPDHAETHAALAKYYEEIGDSAAAEQHRSLSGASQTAVP